jgi:hypothetical protein
LGDYAFSKRRVHPVTAVPVGAKPDENRNWPIRTTIMPLMAPDPLRLLAAGTVLNTVSAPGETLVPG